VFKNILISFFTMISFNYLLVICIN